MLRNIESIIGNRIIAKDGFAGKAQGVVISLLDWKVAELIVTVTGWFRSPRNVRIPGLALKSPVGRADMLLVSLPKRQIRKSPLTDEHSRSHQDLRDDLISAGNRAAESDAHQLVTWESIAGYRTYALDGFIGSLKDLIVEDEQWTIRYLVVELSLEDATHQTLVSSDWVSGVHEGKSSVSLNLSISETAGSPEYDVSVPVSRDIERMFSSYYEHMLSERG
jgi:hypothetical protein